MTNPSDQPADHQQVQRDDDQQIDLRTIVPFSPKRFARQLTLDRSARWALSITVALVVMISIGMGPVGGVVTLLVLMGLIFAWVQIGRRTATVSAQLPSITQIINVEPAHAEHALAHLLDSRILMPAVRAQLYQHLALLRARQGDHAQAYAIAVTLLSDPKSPARMSPGSLLLLLTECCLAMGDLAGAYAALCQLHITPLTLREAIHRLALRTQYEVAIGADNQALEPWQSRLQMSEMMPPARCAIMHGLLATAATRTGRDTLANWLWQRCELLAEPEHYARMRRGEFALPSASELVAD